MKKLNKNKSEEDMSKGTIAILLTIAMIIAISAVLIITGPLESPSKVKYIKASIKISPEKLIEETEFIKESENAHLDNNLFQNSQLIKT